eukprot:3939865-Rhodomonas_salina.2
MATFCTTGCLLRDREQLHAARANKIPLFVHHTVPSQPRTHIAGGSAVCRLNAPAAPSKSRNAAAQHCELREKGRPCLLRPIPSELEGTDADHPFLCDF